MTIAAGQLVREDPRELAGLQIVVSP